MGKLNWFGEFKDRQKEDKFQVYKWPSVRIRFLFLYLVTIVWYAAATCGDYFNLGAGADFDTLLVSRTAVCGLGLFSFVFALGDKAKLSSQYAVMCFYMFSFMLVESLEVLVKSSAVGALSIPATVFIVLSCYILLPPRMLYSLLAGLGGSFIYLSSLALVVPVSSGVFINSALFFCLANIFGVYFLASFGMSLRREFAALSDLKKLVEYDELTGVCSRRRVLEAGNSLFKSSCRFNNKLAVLMMDIDYFKKVNDEFGHHVGDRVLQETARRCSKGLREVDFFGRLGGEEFVVILPQSSLFQAISVAERLRDLVSESRFDIDEISLPVSVSIGVAELRCHGDFSELLQEADEHLYRAKKCGRNQVSPAMLRVVEVSPNIL